MKEPIKHQVDPNLDLLLERTIDVPRELVWKAWTTPEIILKWFTPAPWKTIECEIDLRPGGIFRTTMQSPEGENFPHAGCFLEIVENEKLAWTSAMAPGYRPITLPETPGCDSITFSAVISLEDVPGGTKYSALVIHGDPESRKRHEEMGFQEGWGKALEQLIEVVKQ